MKGKLIKTDVNYILEDDNGVVIASTSLKKEGLSLSLKNCQAIERGYDLDELADEFAKTKSSHSTFQNTHKRDFREGFQKALELMGDKKFSKQDMINFSEFVSGKYINQYKFLRDKSLKGFFSTDEILKEYQSLQQTEWDVEIEMVKEHIGSGCYKKYPKLDDEGFLILKKYKNG